MSIFYRRPSRARKAGSSSVCSNAKPVSSSFFGTARILAKSASSAISPNITRSANRGSQKNAGRRSTRPSVLANSRFVTGFGATRFTGPRTASVARQWRIARAVSPTVIHGTHCLPEPRIAPAPSLKARSCFPRRRPSGSGRRRFAGSRYGCPRRRRRGCLFPHLANLGEKPDAARGLLGQHLIAAIAVITDRRGADERFRPRSGGSAATASARFRVGPTRLSMILRFFSAVHRPLATLSPAR